MTTMISDKQTNKVFLSKGLMGYGRALERILCAFSGWEVHSEYLPLAESKKHIWARDYMPIQLEKDKFLQYRYAPDYLKGYEEYIPDYQAIIKQLGLNCIITDIVLDGGNVIKCGDKVIMTDKIFQENPGMGKEELIAELESLLQAKLVLIPWDKHEMYGHADGMVRYIDGNRVLLNNYADTNQSLRKRLLDALTPHFEVEELHYGKSSNTELSWAYLNFLQTEKVIFIPAFYIREDDMAKEQIAALYPKFKIVQIHDVEDIVRDGGALNCISWNILADVPERSKSVA